MSNCETHRADLSWVDALKVLALLGILLNHLVEEFGTGPWFTNPSNDWPDFSTRIVNVFPNDYASPFISFIQFLGWLGDSCPGVFLLLSGFGLTWSYLSKEHSFSTLDFYKRRALRIYPVYIAVHFVILGGALLIPAADLSLASTRTFFSLLGLRFEPSLFFYISPSWWFVWLIIQLYLLFPLLVLWMDKYGVTRFMAATLIFTFVFRALGVCCSNHLYFWMTGIFFGTRLAEFTVGMLLAAHLFKRKDEPNDSSGILRILLSSSMMYLLGFACSLFLIGTIFSNFLVTVGMTGLFYCLWSIFLRKSTFLNRPLNWMSKHSYGVYLIHQTPLKWAAVITPGTWHLAGACSFILLSFPAAWFIQMLVSRWLPAFFNRLNRDTVSKSSILISILIISALFYEPLVDRSSVHRILSLLTGLLILYLLYTGYISRRAGDAPYGLLIDTSMISAGICLFLFSGGHGFSALCMGILIALLAGIVRLATKSKIRAYAVAVSVAVCVFAVMEITFARHFPIEVAQWGELPALEIHPTRTYALKPHQQTRLIYNNYDYAVKTNSFGLASPEIDVRRPDQYTIRVLVVGDAFSMPEGLDYERSYPALLEKQLSRHASLGSVQVINGGVTGYGPLQQYRQMSELLPVFKPDIVVYQYFINEVEDVQKDPEDLLRNIGLVSGRFAKLNILRRSQFLEHSRRFYIARIEKMTGYSHSWRYDKSLLAFYETGENGLYSNENLSLLESYTSAMAGLCRDNGADFVIYFVPGAVAVMNPHDLSYYPGHLDIHDKTRFDLERPFKALERVAVPHGIRVIDLTPVLKRHGNPVYFRDSWHWNPEGHDLVAKEMAEDLVANELRKIKRGGR